MRFKRLFYRFSCVLILPMMLIGLMTFMSACNDSDSHVHAFGEWETVTPATCEDVGVEKRTCSCGETETRELDVDPDAHKYEQWDIVKDANCLTDGEETAQCVLCGHVETKIIPKTPDEHKFSEWITTHEASCQIDGEKTRTCEVCLKVETMPIQKLDHDWGEWTNTRDPQDNCKATHSRTCNRVECGMIETGPCEYNTIDVAPTCEEKGHHTHTCEICNESFTHDYGEELGHSYSELGSYEGLVEGVHKHIVTCLRDSSHTMEVECEFEENVVAPSCTTNGYTQHTCKNCSYVYTDNTVVSNGHQFGDYSYRRTSGVTGEHWRTCSECHFEERTTCSLTPNTFPAECGKQGYTKYTCAICEQNWRISEASSPALEHKWKVWEHKAETDQQHSKHTRECSLCGKVEEYDCHFVTTTQEATCFQSGTIRSHCEFCQYSYETANGNQLEHEWSPWTHEANTDTHYKTCSKCNTKEYGDCSPIEEITLQPSCTTDGTKTIKCSECNNSKTETIEKLGHLLSDASAYQDLGNGKHKFTCLREECKATGEEEHSYTKSNLCDVCQHDGLAYVEYDNQWYVYHDNDIPNASEIIIPEEHNGQPIIGILGGTYQSKICGFSNNDKITSVTLPMSLVSIGDGAFSYCKNLKEVHVRNEGEENFVPHLTTIGKQAFKGCTNLISAFNLPETLTKIGDEAFRDCSSLSKLKIPEKTTDIGSHAFTGTEFVNDKSHWDGDVLYINKHLIVADKNISGNCDIEEGTLNISASAFEDCIYLQSITIAKTITKIDKDAFKNCTGLQSVVFTGSLEDWLSIQFLNDMASPMNHATNLNIEGATGDIEIPSGVTSIPAGTFKNTSITSVKIPASVTYIGEEAFEGSTLKTISFDGEVKLKFVGLNAFNGTPYYKDSQNWDNGALYIGHCLVDTDDSLASEYTIKSGTISIAPKAFEGRVNLTKLTMSEELIYIGEEALVGCTGLKEIDFKVFGDWFANTKGYMARVLDEDDLSEDHRSQDFIVGLLTRTYTGEWTKLGK